MTRRIARLTEREAEVLAGIALGLSNKEIGHHTGMADSTVKVHVKSILRKLNAKTRTHAAVMVTRAALAAPCPHCGHVDDGEAEPILINGGVHPLD